MRNDAIRWKISVYVEIKSSIFFRLTVTVSYVLMLQTFDLRNLGHRVQHSQ